MSMNALQAYRYYLALRMHFTTDRYDIVKHKGRIKVSNASFMKHEAICKRLSKKFNDEELVNYLVSNFVSGDQWGGFFDPKAEDVYMSWKKRIESLSYTFTHDMKRILDNLNLIEFDRAKVFLVEKNVHPYIIRAYLGKEISIETLVILNKLFKFCDTFDNEIEETLVWPDISKLIRKYNPFVKVDKDKFHAILRGL